MKKTIYFICSIILFLFFINRFPAYSQESDKPKLIIFHSLTCHSCIKVKKEIMPEIEKEYKDKLIFEYRDIADIENYKLLVSLQEKHSVKLSNDLPIFYLEGNFINGEKNIKAHWRKFIAQSLRSQNKDMRGLPSIDLVSRFKSFKFFTIISAGLIDGVNPCVFTVLVFFLSFLTVQGYIKRELIAIGLSFILAVFMAYVLIGLGAFTFLYQMSGFWIIAKIVNYSVGMFAILLGILAIYDFFKFKKTGKTEGLALQLPQALKNKIHKIVGRHYRIIKNEEGIITRSHIFKLILSALIAGFLISLHESVCTGQVYLPTITFILKTTSFRLQAIGYLLTYNFMFIVPLLVIFIFALSGATSGQFSQFLKKHLLTIKVLMAILFFSLGMFLILRA